MLLASLGQGICDISSQYENITVNGLTADSRDIKEGFLFAAFIGSLANGADYINDAINNGASVILGSKGVEYNVPDNIVLLLVDNPRLVFAQMAARFFYPQPDNVVAITGTNGKTSVAAFLQQIWQEMDYSSATIGTVGVRTNNNYYELRHTTPEPAELHYFLNMLSEKKITHVAIEASSHGLDQCRLDGVKLQASAFTNITQDHLDYHSEGGFEEYFACKLRLFTELTPIGKPCVIFMDDPYSTRIVRAAIEAGRKVFSVGENGSDLRMVNRERKAHSQIINVEYMGKVYKIDLPLIGDFQASNVLISMGLALVMGINIENIITAISKFSGAKGRLEKIVVTKDNVPIFVDYAHTPDALRQILLTLKPYTRGNLILVFGCGGDRDKSKRPMMGKIASEYADLIYVTDDNPRSEIASDIRKEILIECPEAIEIGDRRKAIASAIVASKSGDLIVIAGKGHETGQVVGNETLPFSDHDVILEIASN